MTKTDMILQTALNSALCSAVDLSDERTIEEYITVALKNAFRSKEVCNIVIDKVCETLKQYKY